MAEFKIGDKVKIKGSTRYGFEGYDTEWLGVLEVSHVSTTVAGVFLCGPVGHDPLKTHESDGGSLAFYVSELELVPDAMQ